MLFRYYKERNKYHLLFKYTLPVEILKIVVRMSFQYDNSATLVSQALWLVALSLHLSALHRNGKDEIHAQNFAKILMEHKTSHDNK